jgi:hypothetical protein
MKRQQNGRRKANWLPFAKPLAVPKRDSAFCQVVGGQFQGYFIARKHADTVAPQSACQVGQDDALMFKLNAELAGRKLFQHSAGYFDAIFFTHKPPASDLADRID